MLGCGIDACGREAQYGLDVCAVHRVKFQDALDEFPGLVVELETTATRQAQLTPGGGSGGERPLVYAKDAADLLWVVRNTLDAWANELTYWQPLPLAGHVVGSRAAGARFLRARLRWALRIPDAAQMVDEVTALADACTRAIDRPADLSYAGRCQLCSKPLYAIEDAVEVECRACGWRTDVDQRRRELLEAAEDMVLRAVDVSRACTSLGAEVKPATIRQWKARGKLEPAGCDLKSKAELYRVGDVLDLRGA